MNRVFLILIIASAASTMSLGNGELIDDNEDTADIITITSQPS